MGVKLRLRDFLCLTSTQTHDAWSAENAGAASFLKARFIRLIPGTIVCSSLTAAVLWIAGSEHGQMLLRAWIRSAIIYVHGPWVDGSYWTLPIEVSFYACIFLLILTGWKHRIPFVIGAIGMSSSAAWILIATAGLLPLSISSMHTVAHLRSLMTHNWFVFILLLTHGCFFAEGVFLYLCLLKGVTRRRIAVMAMCSIGAFIEICNHAHSIVFDWVRVKIPHHPAVPCIAWSISFIAIILSARWNRRIVDALKHHVVWLRWAGLMTYPLYLINMRVGYVLIADLHRYLPDTISMLIATALLLMLAYAIARFAEPLLQGLFKRVFFRAGEWRDRRKVIVAG